MTVKKTDPGPVHEAPMTYRDFPGEVPDSVPVVAMVAQSPVPDPDPEPAKPASKKEN